MNSQSAKTAADGNSTWDGNDSGTGQWNTATNWSPAGVPSETDTAIFGTSPTISIDLVQAGNAMVNNIEFASGASSYTLNFKFPQPTQPEAEPPALTVTGTGVSNSSGETQSFIVASAGYSYKNPQLQFINSANAGGDNVSYSVGPATPDGYGGGVLGFSNDSSAGSALFTVRTGSGTPPKKNSTVGGEVSFADNSKAASATFNIYGSTSLLDGDTFANVVFHQLATADSAKLTNTGGTVPGGDGGNTQFYNSSTAANGIFQNQGGTAYGQLSVLENGKIVPKVVKDGPAMQGANGGDVAFDATSTGGNGQFHNQAAPVAGAHGGVTSFNNNWPPVKVPGGSSAGSGTYYNYGAVAHPTGGGATQKDGNEPQKGGGGHAEFTALWGCPTSYPQKVCK